MSQDPRVALSQIRIVLVEPAGPLNVGSVARVMKNFGLQHLVLVKPHCDPLGEEAMQMAVHAKDLLEAARIVADIPAALDGCYLAIATTARPRDINTPLELPEQALPALLHPIDNPQAGDQPLSMGDRALIFGPEDRGLSNEELIHAQKFVKIPTDDRYSALNLAQAVAVCCYELHRVSNLRLREFTELNPTDLEQKLANTLRTSPSSDKQTESRLQKSNLQRESASTSVQHQAQPPAQLNELEGYYQHLESVLLQVEYLYPHTAASRMRKIRQLLQRATPTSAEVALLRGMLRQVEWALSESQKG